MAAVTAAVDDLPRESWQVPPSKLRPRERAAALLDLVEKYAWTLEFVVTPDLKRFDERRHTRRGQTGTVHILSPDGDQPFYATAAENLMGYRWRTVCGLIIHSPMMYGGVLGHPFPDENLCKNCHRAFTTIRLEAGAVIFEHNTEWAMDGSNQSARRALEYDEEERAREAPRSA